MAAAVECVKVGTTVESRATFTKRGDLVPSDPAAVQVTVRKPDGTSATHLWGGVGSPVVREAAGIFTVAVVPDMHGRWWFIWQASSPLPGLNAVGEDSINIEKVIA